MVSGLRLKVKGESRKVKVEGGGQGARDKGIGNRGKTGNK
jgi:hypothetical protein